MDTLRGTFDSGVPADDSQDWDAQTGAPEEEKVRELPPEAIGQDERRMQVRAYNHWASLLGDANFPSIEDLEPGHVRQAHVEHHRAIGAFRVGGQRFRAGCRHIHAVALFLEHHAVGRRKRQGILHDQHMTRIAARAGFGTFCSRHSLLPDLIAGFRTVSITQLR